MKKGLAFRGPRGHHSGIRAALGALWADESFSSELTAVLRSHPSLEAQQAAQALTRLAERYRPIVAAQRGRIAKDIPALSRLEKLGSFEDLGSFFEGTAERPGALEPEGAVAAVAEHPGQLSLFDEATMARVEGRALARPVEGQRQGVSLEREVPALSGAALGSLAQEAAAARSPGKGVKGMARKASGLVKENRTFLGGYLGIIGVAVPSVGGILMAGGTGGALKATAAAALSHAVLGPVGLLLLQMMVIIGVSLLLGKLLARIGQPAVVGQVLGGLLLGPSLLGGMVPGMMGTLFPAGSLAFLDPLSQIGLVVFMFIVGLELDTKLLRKQGGEAAMMSHAGIALSFILGTALALVLFTGFAPAGVPFHVFALFLGVSLSITAFPVLASMLKERKELHTPTGQLVMTAAAVDDATAWPLLAVVVAIASTGSGMGALPMLAATVGFAVFMMTAGKRLMARYVDGLSQEAQNEASSAVVPLLMMLAAALATHVIGVHALFGAFLAGAVIPRDSLLRKNMEEWLGKFAAVLLLPIFFAQTGLRTELGLLGGWENAAITAGIVVVAIAGKLFGAGIVQRFVYKKSWHKALTAGAFMSTKGLMELIVLNIGYELGILSPTLFAMLVVMAVATTFLASPLVSLVRYLFKEPATAAATQTA